MVKKAVIQFQIYFIFDDALVEYSYNAEDYRVGKRVVDTNGVEVVQYFYEGDHVLFETDGTGSITAYNLYGNHLISRSVQGEQYYYLYNAHGDVVMLVDADSGAVAATYRYDAFGNLMQQTGDVDNNITYAGYQYDEETGLYYLNARYYNSNIGRFLTEDTYRGRQQDPLSLHRYTYCHNNPLNYYDPSGHIFEKIPSIINAGWDAFEGLLEGAVTSVWDTACLGYYSAAYDVGGIMHFVGAMDDQTWAYYQDIAYETIDTYYERSGILKPAVDCLAYGVGSGYMALTVEDQQTIKNFHEIAQEELVADGKDMLNTLGACGSSLLNEINLTSMYKFLFDPTTSQEEMDKYASDLLGLGLLLVPVAKRCSGLKFTKGPKIGIGTQSYAFNPNGTLVAAGSVLKIPTVAVTGELVAVPPAYYAASAWGFVETSTGGGTGGGGDQSGSKTIDDIIDSLPETTNGKGVARNFESTGGFKQTIKDFDSLNPIDVKEIQTQYGLGKVGKLSDGTTVVARPGSTTGGATLEIRVSNSKVYKIRY